MRGRLSVIAGGLLLALVAGCSRRLTDSDDELREQASALIGDYLHRNWDRPSDTVENLQDRALNLALAKGVLGHTSNPELSITIFFKGERGWRSDYWPVWITVSGSYVFSQRGDFTVKRGLLKFGYRMKMRVRSGSPSDIEDVAALSADEVQALPDEVKALP